jgi:hypothetical protein
VVTIDKKKFVFATWKCWLLSDFFSFQFFVPAHISPSSGAELRLRSFVRSPFFPSNKEWPKVGTNASGFQTFSFFLFLSLFSWRYDSTSS